MDIVVGGWFRMCVCVSVDVGADGWFRVGVDLCGWGCEWMA